ncbi:MAG TPA: hypothetical protein VJ600_02435 [Holophagaceae bacterium]|nr:hypothetical protein [Holophagaceae bacterium]
MKPFSTCSSAGWSALALTLLLACSGGSSPKSSPSGSSPSQTVSLSPDVNRITMTEQHNRQFKVTVSGTDNQAVTWKVLEADGGTIDAAGNYTAPDQVGTYHIQVASAANPSVNSTIETTVVPPATIGTFVASKGYTTSGGAVTLTASWSGGTASIDHGVGALATSPATPTVNPTSSTAYNLTVINSAGDPTIQSVFVKVDGTISVYVTPTAVRLGIRQSYAFVAVVTGATDNRVTWSVEEGASGGTINYAGAYTAPANSAGVFHVRATSVEDPTKYSRSTVTVTYGWSSPQALDPNLGTYGDLMSLAGDPVSGNAFAVWMETDPTSGHTVPWAARFTASTGMWGDYRAISDGFADGTALGHTSIATDGQGNAMAIWAQSTTSSGSRNDLFAAYFKSGVGWQARTLLSDGAHSVDDLPKVVMDGTGAAIAVWTETNGTYSQMWGAHFTGGVWAASAQLASDSLGSATPPGIAMDGSGNAVLVWAQPDATALSILSERYIAGSGWTSPLFLESGAGVVDAPTYGSATPVAMAADGSAVVLWSQDDGTGKKVIMKATYSTGLGWSAAAPLYADASQNSTLPNIVMDASGNAVAAWFTGGQVLSTRYSATTFSWSSVTNPSSSTTANVFGTPPSLTMDGSGDAIVSWSDGTDLTAWASSVLAGGSWRTPVRLQDPNTISSLPTMDGAALFLDSQGRGLAVMPSKPSAQTHLIWTRLQ